MSGKSFSMGRKSMALWGALLVALALFLGVWLIPWSGDDDLSPHAEKSSSASGNEEGKGESQEAPGRMSETDETVPGESQEGDEAMGASVEEEEQGTVNAAASGEDFSDPSPTRRYVTETQRHQNFLAAVAAGRVRRMDFISTDYQPASDPNSSYITFSVLTSEGNRSTGLMVMKQESGMWRISAVKQLSGYLAGGTNYLVPAVFEEVLAAELQQHQLFFSKLAQGRVSALIVDEDHHPSETETVLIGRVVGRSGRVENTVMTLRKDYNLWHLTGFDYR